ncbi:MAG: hypothetical protein LBR07_09415 [Puniceicoccales bacterium]|jgi:hypothetical protein|nr:hypothetical protein [Puniceicoccales bacterium]
MNTDTDESAAGTAESAGTGGGENTAGGEARPPAADPVLSDPWGSLSVAAWSPPRATIGRLVARRHTGTETPPVTDAPPPETQGSDPQPEDAAGQIPATLDAGQETRAPSAAPPSPPPSPSPPPPLFANLPAGGAENSTGGATGGGGFWGFIRRLFGFGGADASASAAVFAEPLPVERQPEQKPPPDAEGSGGRPWIGVDLDGTLAVGGQWAGLDFVGEPVPVMLARVRHWLANGYRVKIFTARAVNKGSIPAIKRWLLKHGLPDLEVTNAKDFSMLELWDDRAVQVVQNTGRPFLSASVFGRPAAPLLEQEIPGQTFYPPEILAALGTGGAVPVAMQPAMAQPMAPAMPVVPVAPAAPAAVPAQTPQSPPAAHSQSGVRELPPESDAPLPDAAHAIRERAAAARLKRLAAAGKTS